LEELRAIDPHNSSDVTEVLAAGARAALHDVLAALYRIDTGSYGSCTDCGTPLPVQRLEVLPPGGPCLECRRRPARPHPHPHPLLVLVSADHFDHGNLVARYQNKVGRVGRTNVATVTVPTVPSDPPDPAPIPQPSEAESETTHDAERAAQVLKRLTGVEQH